MLQLSVQRDVILTVAAAVGSEMDPSICVFWMRWSNSVVFRLCASVWVFWTLAIMWQCHKNLASIPRFQVIHITEQQLSQSYMTAVSHNL